MVDGLARPAAMFDRDFEWSELSRFVGHPGQEPALGIVSGRRRQGKTFLLDAVCRATGGFYFAGTEATAAESLRQFGVALGRFTDQPVPYRFHRWDEAVDALMAVGAGRAAPVPVVLDEFPYLVRPAPELPSLLQRALGPQGRQAGVAPVRLLLCGSALSFMGGLLAGTAPLRGRASLELVVPTLDFRLAAEFWGIADPRLATMVNAVVGGTPAYAREFTLGDAPTSMADFGPWVVRNVLNPGRPLFREARFLLAEEPALRDTALYHGVLSAVAEGNHTRGGIANYVGRRSTDLGHALTVLEDAGLLARDPDAFHGRRSTYRIVEPILTFYHAVMRPEWSDLERPGQAAGVWDRSAETFRSRVLGPHFEHLCRTWARWYAAPETLGGQRTRVASGTVTDAAARTGHEVDVVVFGRTPAGGEALLALGEAKWNETMGLTHLRRLEHLRTLLRARSEPDADPPRLFCFSGAGFAADLRARALADPGVQLVDLDRLYAGS